ncbi:chorismate--pyruvate lyase family protein [Parachitinimonas caeni]|uniref:Probable chorismate pyruvate-lyase n=1 Tax=Parachitinimonas caeni TaxID=3031301 RepID=A0ABT7DVW6_9NEIS|nr:chorismate lyase [Parachitinimonas caeni]MDK2124204.1 chorismate lyase [Parachitinimonas caeni]
MYTRRLWRQPLCQAPRRLHPWLQHQASLTARLQAHFPDVHVRLLHQGWSRPHADELGEIGMQRPQRTLCREVLLLSGDTPLVFAHSVAGHDALRHGFRLLSRQGTRPLGATLFAKPQITRHPLSWCRIDRRHPLWRKAAQAAGPLPSVLWARRSLFSLGTARLLVTEVFLPAIRREVA